MLRDLVSQARSAATSSSAGDLEAITAERDFFREKYAEQINVMEHLNGQLKESQRIIDKLRSQILDLEMEKSSRTNVEESNTNNNIGGGMGSGSSSVTCLTSCEDETVKTNRMVGDSDADVVKVIESTVDDEVSDINSSTPTTTNNAQDVGSSSTPTDNQEQSETIESGEESDDTEREGKDSDEEEEDDDDDDIDRIRANAERMLMWANYQTSKRSTPNTSILSQDDDNESKYSESSTRRSQTTPTTKGTISAGGDAIVYSLPASLDKRQISSEDEDSDNSTLGSSSRNQPEPCHRSGTSATTTNNEKSGSGKIGKLFNNLKDMIDGGDSESEESESSVSDDESTDSNFADRVIVQAEL